MFSKEYKNHILVVLLVVLFLFILSIYDYFTHETSHDFSFENIPFFSGILGIFGAIFITLVVKLLGKIVAREEEEYDRYYTS